MKKRILCLMVVALLVLTTACQGNGTSNDDKNVQQNEDKQNSTSNEAKGGYEDTIKIGVDVDASIIDPRLSNNVISKRVMELVYDGLVELDENLQPVPMLAESWEQKDDTTWIFNLRHGVKFHDGTDFNAEDVKVTFDTLLNPDFPAVGRSNYMWLKEINIIDDYTVEFKLNEPYAPFFSSLELSIIPNEVGMDTEFGNNPVGTGAYTFESWTKNSKIVLKANEDYWNGKPKTENIEMYVVPDNSTRVAALEAGDVDLITSPLSAADVERMENNDKVVVDKQSGLGFTLLYFNQESEILKDKNIRVALTHLIDKETISSGIFLNLDTPATSAILPSSWAYTDKTTSYEYDPEKAKALLEEAGWKDTNGDGILDKDGKKLSIRLATHNEDPNRIQTMEYIQNLFTTNGIEATVKTTEWASFSADLEAGDFDIACAGMLNITDPDKFFYNSFHSNGGVNYERYKNPEYDKIVEEARATSDVEKRTELYQQAAQMINDDVAQDLLLYQAYVAIYDKNMEGYIPHPAGSFRSLIKTQVKK